MLSDRVVVVVGGGAGLGAAVAEGLAEEGASVVVSDLGTSVRGEGESPEPAEAVADRIREAGGEAVAHFGDVASLPDTRDLRETALDTYGRVDGVANFAGILRDELSYRMTADQFDAVVRTHLRGHFALLRTFGAHWRGNAGDRERERSFLGVSSLAALGNVAQVNYAAAKAGVFGLVRSASTELYRHDVRANTLVPSGYTRMTETVPEEHRPYTREEMPPERVVPLVAYLMSEAATDVTGNVFYAGGDRVGLVSEPRLHRVGVRPGGWSPEAVAAEMEAIAGDVDLTRTERFF